ncbi:MAG: MBOAT family O-acyltransferase [Muribaculaceae bacterium]
MELSTAIDNLLHCLTFDATNPMIFSSGLFWVLFIVFLPVYALLKRRRVQMMVFVLAFSMYFYYKSSGWFFLLLVATSLCDWLLSHAICRATVRWKRRVLASVSICLSLSVLGYFKYANFFLWNWCAMVNGNFQPLDIILPVGISFYTFQSISYVVDVYKRGIEPTRSWLEYAFYLSFFPQLVAGPIVRADYFLPQLRENRPASREMVYAGLWLVIVGIVKKAIIADYIAQYNDLIFSNAAGYGGFETLMGIVGYTMQIYCDFSGYSDMAIGIASILGFKLSENFRLPYQSKNITEFWRRWHISLSSWLRDYVYIPLGGNRRGPWRTYANNLATMLIGGLWHGASWKFVFWGGMHGVGLMVHKALRPWLGRIADTRLTRAACWAVTMIFVSLLWVFFRADTFADALTIIGNAFGSFDAAHIAPFVAERATWCVMMVVIIATHAMPIEWHARASRWFVGTPWIVKLLLFALVVQLTIQFMSAEVKPFIYFQF